ncbi:MAG: DUF3800 domain-containing protein [Pseudomonadota bacterium]|nr:DUF3800 domain-containing protein [Pseudomonadota bacterium]
MFVMYVDESGDPGMKGSPTRYFMLSGVVIHELTWIPALDALVAYRAKMRGRFGLKLREEIHAAHFISKPGSLGRIRRHDRLTMLRHFADEIARLQGISIINVIVDKQGKPESYDPFEKGWQALIQRFENTIRHRNFPSQVNADERGMIYPDGLPMQKLTGLMRRMRRHNPVPSQVGGFRSLLLTKVVEDPVYRDSRHSLFVQAADLAAFLLYQNTVPNAYMKKSGGWKYFDRLGPVMCTSASANDPQGIVRL